MKITLLNEMTDAQIAHVAVMLEAMKLALDEAEDDAFCQALRKEYEDDPEKDDCVRIQTLQKNWVWS